MLSSTLCHTVPVSCERIVGDGTAPPEDSTGFGRWRSKMATFASRSNRRLLSASFTGAAADVERPTVFGVVVNVDGRPAVICAVLVSAKRPGACEEGG